jgi:hypothetical protein
MTPDAQERRAWDLLVESFEWDVPQGHPVEIRSTSGDLLSSARVQIFELVVTAILARIRPEFRWSVTPNRQDHGLDFLGVNRFLDDNELGITAAITVGGQCKKRTSVNKVLDEIAGSLIDMADTVNPNLIVVALSAHLTHERVEKAQRKFERQCRRHCHILERSQIEGLMAAHVGVVAEILSYSRLDESQRDDVVAYLKARTASAPRPSVEVSPPPRVLAGLPFRLQVDIRWALAANPDARLWWRPRVGDPDPGMVTLIGPIGADSARGMEIINAGTADNPFSASCVLELMTYNIGCADLGELIIGLNSSDIDSACRISLGEVDVIENMRPRFFEQPYRRALVRLKEEYEHVLACSPRSVGVIGAGGSGKSRLCEEFSLERRRRGCAVVTVRHPKTHEAPLRMLGQLLAELAEARPSTKAPADEVLDAIERYDQALATRAASGIRSLFGTRTSAPVDVTEQHLVSAILLLVIARSRRAPLIVHLQDLHWCSVEVLSLLERTVQQITQLCDGPSAAAAGRVLFLFEGRSRESGESGEEIWTSAPFEAFLARTESTVITCSSFAPDDGLTFTRLLFEDRHNAHRLVADDLLQLQDELVSRICKSAGSNPFHTLEQIRFLKELGVVGQNTKTGLLYMIRPEPGGTVLPDSVFDAIGSRWRYMQTRAPELALLVWGSALLDDQIPAPLFSRLWRDLAPTISVRDIDATDMLWTGDGTSQEVVFRHENYFESIRRFTVSDENRRRVVEAYCDWFASLRRPSPAERFGWAQVILQLPEPDRHRARALLMSAQKSSIKSGDPRLTRRIQGFYLDLTWENRSTIAMTAFLRHCDEECDLCRELLGVDRDQAAARIKRALSYITDRVRSVADTIPGKTRYHLLRRLLAAESLHAQLLFNYGQPTEAGKIAARVINSVQARSLRSSEGIDWELLKMEALYTMSCAQAISGEFDSAVRSSADAAEIATRVKSPLARNVVSTYGSMLLSEAPERGELVLRKCAEEWPDDESSDASLVHVHLSMALVLQAYPLGPRSPKRRAMLDEARDRMTRVHDLCRRLGLYADAGAAALVRGVVSALSADDDQAAWFAQGVAAAARGRQMETLWRSHINLAMALYQRERRVSPTAHDHALAALEIMRETLAVYSDPERSPRFAMLSIGLAGAVWLLIATEDDTGLAVLEQYPSLRSRFENPAAGVLKEYDGGERHFQWLRVRDVDYVLY